MRDIYDILKMEKGKVNKYKNILEQIYSEEFEDYTTNVSTKKMCASFNTMHLMNVLINKYRLTSIAELGSGFSTYCLKQIILRKNNNNIKLISVEHDEEWLKKTKQFLIKYNTNTDNLMTTDEFIKYSKNNKIQLVFFDVFHMSDGSRKEYYEKISDNLKHSIIIFDDMHKEEMANEIIEIANKKDMEIMTAIFSKDKYKRFAYVAVPNSKVL